MAHAGNTTSEPSRLLDVATSAITGFILFAVAAFLVFASTAKYARKETVIGQVSPSAGAFLLQSKLTGNASRVNVAEGQFVRAGDEVLSISSDSILPDNTSLVASLNALHRIQAAAQESQATARENQLKTHREELQARRNGVLTDIARLKDVEQLLAKRMRLQRENVDAQRKLAQQGMISRAAVRLHEDQQLNIAQQVHQARREIAVQLSQSAQIDAQIRRVDAEFDLTRSDAAAASAQFRERTLNVENHQGHRVVSPIDGIVTALRVRAGTPVQLGQTLAVVIPTAGKGGVSKLEVELWVPSKAVGFVQRGDKVRIMYDAFPYQVFGVGKGVVTEISGSPLQPNEAGLPNDGRELLFRIRIALAEQRLSAYGKTWPIVPGMRVSADLVLEEQSLANYLLTPWKSLSKR